MKDYTTIPRVIDVFPKTVAKADTAPGAKDGTPVHKYWVDDFLGMMQAVLNGASMTPDDVREQVSLPAGNVAGSQFIEALMKMLGGPGEVVGWPSVTIPTGKRLLKLVGQVIERADYPLLDVVWCGGTANPTAAAYFRCTDPVNPFTTRSSAGLYMYLPDYRGAFLRGHDPTNIHDPEPGRSFGDFQGDALQQHHHASIFYDGVELTGREGIITGTLPYVHVQYDAKGTSLDTGNVDGPSTASETRPGNTILTWCIRY